jgi:hypothetical protein
VELVQVFLVPVALAQKILAVAVDHVSRLRLVVPEVQEL